MQGDAQPMLQGDAQPVLQGDAQPVLQHALQGNARTAQCDAFSAPSPGLCARSVPLLPAVSHCSTGPLVPVPTAPHHCTQAGAAALPHFIAGEKELQRRRRRWLLLLSLAAPQHLHGLLHRSHHHPIHLQGHPWAQQHATHPPPTPPDPPPPPGRTPGPAAIASPHGWQQRPQRGLRSPGTESSAAR